MTEQPAAEPEKGVTSGAATALLSALLFGITTPLAKTFLEESNPLLIAGLLYLGSGLGLSLWRTIQDRGWQSTGLKGSDWSWLAAATVAGGVVAPALLMFGLSRSDAATSSLFLNLEVVFSAVLAWVVFREATGRRVVLGFIAIFAGSVLLAWPVHGVLPGRSIGLICIAGACFFWGIDNNVTRKISAGDARVIAGIKGIVAGSTNTLLALLIGAKWPGAQDLGGALLLGFFGYGVSLVLFIVALRHLGTARTGAYFSTAPFIGSVLSVVLFGQPLTTAFYVAGVLMAIGVWLHITEQHEHEHRHEPFTHRHAHVHDAHHQHSHGAGADPAEPHTHEHDHVPLRHSHPHFPDIHHQHQHR
jgi:drug/metabolite transporter (DMT)-like permease